MKALVRIMGWIAMAERVAFLRGLALTAVVLAMGVALLALSGWFITAAAAAGMIGLGTVFNVFAPSAMVRFLALGRTAARYGERLTTHDATLRALSALRVRLLQGVLHAPYRQMERLRASVFLNRVTADVDALDGVSLRLLLPGLAGLTIVGLAAIGIGILVHPAIGWVITVGYGVAPSVVFLLGQRSADRPSRRAERGMQALRSHLIDMITVREELAAFGVLPDAQAAAARAVDYHRSAQADRDRIERRTGLAIDLLGWAVTAVTLYLGATLAGRATITPAQAAIGVFAALALAEAVFPVRRALSEIGRMRMAARRIAPMLDAAAASDPPQNSAPQHGKLRIEGLQLQRGAQGIALFAPLSFSILPGETVALTGRSGCGKSTVLLAAAGHIAPSAGDITLGGISTHTMLENTLTGLMGMVPQRHALVAGSIADNLRLAAPDVDDASLWQALEATQLADTVRNKGGLDHQLGFRGTGLSGGEARRLVLARAVLCQPQVLLLDEPTEGLDGPLAERVLRGIRNQLPDAAILMAAHRVEEVTFSDRTVALRAPAPLKITRAK